jgi:hypothetical protein
MGSGLLFCHFPPPLCLFFYHSEIPGESCRLMKHFYGNIRRPVKDRQECCRCSGRMPSVLLPILKRLYLSSIIRP